MDSDPIFEKDFWKERLADAKNRGQVHFSVYLSSPELWAYIEKHHTRLIRKYIPEDAQVLDAACGYGRLAPLIKNYTGVDFSPDLLEEARTLYPEKTFVEADLRKLPFEDGQFDWAVVASVRHMITGRKGKEVWAECEAELRRVAKKLLVLEYYPDDNGEPVAEVI